MSNGDAKPAWETDPDVTPVPPDRATPQSWRKQADVEGVPGHWQDGQWETYGSTNPDDPNFGVGPPPPTSFGQKLGMAGQSFVRGFQLARPLPQEKLAEDPEDPSVKRTPGTLAHEVNRRRQLEKEQKSAEYVTGSRWLSSIPEFAGEVAGDPSMWVGVPGSSTTARKAAGTAAGAMVPEAIQESRLGRATARSWGRWSQTRAEAAEADRAMRSWNRVTPGMRNDVPLRNLWQIVEVAIGSIPGGKPIVREAERMQTRQADTLGDIIHEMATPADELAEEYAQPLYRDEQGNVIHPEAGRHGRELTGGAEIYEHFRSLGYPPDAAAALGLGNWQARLSQDERRLLESVFRRPPGGNVTNIRAANHAQDMDRLFDHIANSSDHSLLSSQVFGTLTRDMSLEQRQLLAALMLQRMGTTFRGAQGQLRFGGQWTLENYLRNWEGMAPQVRSMVFGPQAIGTYYERDVNRIIEGIQAVRRYAPMAAQGTRDMSRRAFPMPHPVGSWTEGAAMIGGILGWLAGEARGKKLAIATAGFAGATQAAAWGITNPNKARWVARQLTRYLALTAEHHRRQGGLDAAINDPDFLDELNIAQGPEAPLTDPLDRGPWRVPKPLPQ